jgi:hypothetical protein
MVNEGQIRELSRLLKEMNRLLEEILRIQPEIKDPRWIEAISTIEEGFAKAVNFIAEAEGKRLPPFLTSEEIDELLGAPLGGAVRRTSGRQPM